MATKYWISTSSTSFNTASNWSDGVAPANSDTLIWNGLGTANVETNLSTSLTGLTLIIEQSYTGQIGVLSGNTATYLTINGGTVHIGQNAGGTNNGGAPLVMIDHGADDNANAATVYVYDSCSTSSDSNYPPVLIRNSSASAEFVGVYQVGGGNIGLAALAGDTVSGGNKFNLYVSRAEDGRTPNVPAQAYVGRAATTTELEAGAGTIYSRSSNTTTTLNLSGSASMTYEGSGTLSAVAVYEGATLIDAGTYGTNGSSLTVAGGVYRFRNPLGVTIGTLNLHKGAVLDLNNGVPGSCSATIALVGCGQHEVTIHSPPGTYF